jgi:hypothetical protein
LQSKVWIFKYFRNGFILEVISIVGIWKIKKFKKRMVSHR